MADRDRTRDLQTPLSPKDHKGIVDYADRVSDTARSFHLEIERTAYRNVLYYLSLQWIKFDSEMRQWRPVALKKSTPRPVTNKLATLVNATASKLVGFRVPITYSPGSDQPEDVAAAMVAEPVQRIIEREANVRALKPIAARWLTLTGNVFLISNYDTSEDAGTVFVGFERCVGCGAVSPPKEIEEAAGACPACKVPGMAFQPAINEKGAPIGQEYPRGRHYTEVETVFSARFDPEATSLEESPYFMVTKTRGQDWVARTYGEKAAETVPLERDSEPYGWYLDWLPYATASGSRGVGAAPNRSLPRARIRRLWIKPKRPEIPNGIYAVLAGDTVLESGEWAYHDEEGQPMFNVAQIQFDQVPGRILGKSRIDDIVPKQDQRNRLESILELHSIRMAGGKWLIPKGSGISRVSGEEGQLLQYTAFPGVPPPQQVSGTSPPPYLMNWLGWIDQEMDDIMGLHEVGRGEAPKGVPSYAGLQLLDERAQEGQSNLMENWAIGWMEWSRQNLNIWREYADDDRTLATGEGAWAVQKFNAARLKGGVDLDVELGINRPRSTVARRASVEQAVMIGAISPYDPQQRYRILESLGIPELMPDYKLDMSLAHRENDVLKTGKEVPPPMPWEDHATQLQIHRRLIMSEEFRALAVDVQAAALKHSMLHMQMLRQMAMEMGAGQIAPRPDGKSKGAGQREPRGTDRGQLDAEAQMASGNGDFGSKAEAGMMREGG